MGDKMSTIRTALVEARDAFESYAQQHMAKDPPQSDKALRNLTLCSLVQAALTELDDQQTLVGDHHRLVRELDVALNGIGAAEQATLGDIVGQVQDGRWKLVPRGLRITLGALDVLTERNRQQAPVDTGGEGLSLAGDRYYTRGQLCEAAAAYALSADPRDPDVDQVYPHHWPWASQWWKPKSHRENVIRAAALLLAEIDRLDCAR